MEENKGILIYAEVTRNGELAPVVLELANAAQDLAQKLGGVEVNALAITSQFSVDKSLFTNNGFDKVFVVQDERLKDYSTEYYSKIAIDVINEVKLRLF